MESDCVNQASEVLDQNRQRLGEDHPDTLKSKSDLGEAYRSAGELATARRVQEEVQAAWQRLRGPDDYQTLRAQYLLALVVFDLGEYGSARTLWKPVVEKYEQQLGNDSPITDGVRIAYSNTLRQLQEFSELKGVEERILASRMRVYGPYDYATLRAMRALILTKRTLSDPDVRSLEGSIAKYRFKGILLRKNLDFGEPRQKKRKAL